MLVIMAGLPGTGKSTLARAVAERTGGIVLDKDVIRAAMFPGAVDYTTEQDDVVIEAMLRAAEYLLHRNFERAVFLDGRPFSLNSQVDRVVEFAGRIPTEWRLVECVCTPQTARSRIEGDRNKHPAFNRGWDLYQRVAAKYQPKPEPKTVVDTDNDISACVENLLLTLTS